MLSLDQLYLHLWSMISFSSGCTIIQLDDLSEARPLNQSNGYCKSNIVWSTEVANIQKCCSGLLGISKILWISTIQTQDSPKPSENHSSSSPVQAWVRFCWASTKSMPVELGFLLWPYALVQPCATECSAVAGTSFAVVSTLDPVSVLSLEPIWWTENAQNSLRSTWETLLVFNLLD